MGCLLSSSQVAPSGERAHFISTDSRRELLQQLGISNATNPLLHDLAGVETEEQEFPETLTVDNIIQHPLLRQLFMIFVSSRMAEENGRFLLDMNQLETNSVSMSEDKARTAIDFM